MSNPIVKLFDMLPTRVAKEKRAAIHEELRQKGDLGHYQQTVMRGTFNARKMRASCQRTLENHLGFSRDFFEKTEEDQQIELTAIAEKYYKAVTHP